MTRAIILRDAAVRDLQDQADYFSASSLDLALRFAQSVGDAFRQLAAMPGIGSLQKYKGVRIAGLRCFRVPGFEKHLIFYLPSDDDIVVIRILHGARDLPRLLREEWDLM